MYYTVSDWYVLNPEYSRNNQQVYKPNQNFPYHYFLFDPQDVWVHIIVKVNLTPWEGQGTLRDTWLFSDHQ